VQLSRTRAKAPLSHPHRRCCEVREVAMQWPHACQPQSSHVMSRGKKMTTRKEWERCVARPKAPSPLADVARPADVFQAKWCDSAWNVAGTLAASCAKKAGAAFRPLPIDAFSRSIERQAKPVKVCSYQPRPSALLNTSTPTPTSTSISALPQNHHQFQQLSSNLSSPRCPLAHRSALHAAGPRRYIHFVTDLALFRSANVTRLPRILQANRVVAHTSYLLSFTPFHTTFPPQQPPSQQPTSQQPRPLQHPRLSIQTRRWRLFPRPSDSSLPHTLTTSSAALTLTPPRP
jgi:hypothetical protein